MQEVEHHKVIAGGDPDKREGIMIESGPHNVCSGFAFFGISFTGCKSCGSSLRSYVLAGTPANKKALAVRSLRQAERGESALECFETARTLARWTSSHRWPSPLRRFLGQDRL